MRGPLIVTAALVATLVAACGGADSNKTSKDVKPSLNAGGEAVVGSTPSSPATPANEEKQAQAERGTYVPPSIIVKTRNGKAPGVVLLPDTGKSAAAEAQKLAKLGVATVVVNGPKAAPTQPRAFERAVADALAAVNQLRKRTGIDATRIGVVGEGVGAHVGAVAIGHAPGKVMAAVLADIGGVVVPAKKYAPERWLERAEHTEMLFQRDTGRRAMTSSEITRLMVAAPPGTLMQQYKDLGTKAQAERDNWIKQILVGT